jgi:CheY-like chemotaxis protein
MEKKRVLLIDDKEVFCRLVKMNLEATGKYEVRTETSGTIAAEAAKQFRPDIIFLDIIMPDINGNEVARQIKADEQLKNIPVVYLTAVVSEDKVDYNQSISGAESYLAKPVKIKKLIECIEKMTGI